jgi:SAM-dependent methyltransferase
MWRRRRRRDTSPRLGAKHLAELAWWERALRDRVEWYRGERTMYGQPPPTPDEKHVRETVEASAGVATVAASRDRYPKALKISSDHFAGMTLLDVGCGPYPLSIAFEGCRIVGLDPLIFRYEAAGFPLAEFTDRVTFVCGFAEEMPFPAESFDAVISVNAIDHVDDFARAASEISRVLKRDGVLRMQVHYHPPRDLEPHALSDEVVLAHLGHLGIKKVSEEAPAAPPRDADSPPKFGPDERLVVWANDE